MRVSTSMIYQSGLGGIQDRTSSLLRVQQQLSSGRRILTPSDDPVAAARALEVTQSQAANKSQATTRDNAKSAMGIADAQLQSATDLLTRVRELTVQAGDASLSASDRQSIALELRQRFDELVGIANAKDGLGNSLFGGFQTGNKPFAGSVEDGVQYLGDDGMRALQVSNSRQLGISQSGNSIFMNIMNGNGVFATATQNDKSVNATHVTYEGTSTLAGTPATTGSFELKFWTDTAGGNAPSAAQSVGTADLNALAYPFSFGAGDQFSVQFDGSPAVTVTMNPPASYNTAADIVTAIQTAIGTAGTVNLDTQGRLTFTSATSGATSSLTNFTDVSGTPLATLMGGVPADTAGVTGAANTTYFDMVDGNGISLFTGTASTTGGTGNTYTHAYTSGAPFALSSAGPQAFDYGASVVFTGKPADGDSFTVNRTATDIAVAAKTVNANAARATIDAGTVSDPLKWGQSGNSGNLEVRFWVDAQGTVQTPGQAVGSIKPVLPLVVTAGTNDTFNVQIDGGGVQVATLAPGSYATPDQVKTAMQNAINGALPVDHGTATVSLDANGKVVITSDSTGVSSSINLTEGNGALAATMGIPAVTSGIGATSGQSSGAVDLSAIVPITVTAGTSDQFTIDVDGAGPRTITLPPATYNTPESIRLAVQQQIDALVGPAVNASVSLDSGNHLVVASGSSGAGSSVVLGAGAGVQDALPTLFGAPTATPGSNTPAGRTFYDLVDAATGKSLFTGTASQTGGAGNTFTRAYTSGSSINLYSAGGGTTALPTFDFGASVTVSGIPAGGDAFTVKSSTDYTGNGYFVTAAKTATNYNTGSGIVGTGEVLDQAKWNSPANSRNLEVRFWQDPKDTNTPPTTYYDLVDAETEKSLFTNSTSTAGGAGNSFTHVFHAGNAIDFSGLNVPYGADTITDFGVSVTINGTPASGDAFKVTASQSQSVFDTLANTIKLLESGKPVGTSGNVQLQNDLGNILTGLGRAGDSISSARAVIGSNLSEIDGLDSTGSALDLQYSDTLSRLQDLDYADAITKLSQNQMQLQAAQQSFTRISQLSLFDYIK